MKKLFKTSDMKIRGLIFFLFALGFFVFSPVVKMITFGAHRQTMVFGGEDMNLQSIIKKSGEDNIYFTTDSDPYFTIELGGVNVESLSFDIQYAHRSGPVVIYYKNVGDENFRELKRFITPDDIDGEYTVKINKKNVSEIRIDPTIYAGMKMKVNKVIVNPEKSLLSYFDTDFRQFVYYVLSAGFTTSFILLAKQILSELIYEKKQEN